MVSVTTATSIALKLAKVAAVLLLIAVIISSIIVWRFADNMVHPPRRALQEYHHYWLNNAAAEGLTITSFDCASGQAPCLFVSPYRKNPSLNLSLDATNPQSGGNTSTNAHTNPQNLSDNPNSGYGNEVRGKGYDICDFEDAFSRYLS